jgi:hypothetical protein
MLRSIALALVRKYPQPWRERYADEVSELLEASPVRVRDLGELFRGLIVERTLALIEDADHPARAVNILSLFSPVFVILFVSVAWGIALGLQGWREFPWSIDGFGASVFLAWAFGFWTIRWRLWRRQKIAGSSPPESSFPSWLGVALLPVLFVVIVAGEWSGWHFSRSTTSAEFYAVYYWAVVLIRIHLYWESASELAASFWPSPRLLSVFGELSVAEHELKAAHTWVEGCKTMIAQGVPSPLDEAQALVDRWTGQRDEARARLHNVGYRARFR